jgi:hypothetical protein
MLTEQQRIKISIYINNNSKKSLRTLERELGVSRTTLRKIIIKYNVDYNIAQSERIKYLEDGDMKCSCGYTGKPKDFFNGAKLRTYCRSCFNNKNREWRNKSVNPFITQKVYEIHKNYSKDIDEEKKITSEYLKNILNNQDNRCFYTDEILANQGRLTKGCKKSKNQISVDKLIPELGYVKGNIVFCSRRANSIKNDLSLKELEKWIPTWFDKIKNKIKSENIFDWEKLYNES